jgi:hypothetical protein
MPSSTKDSYPARNKVVVSARKGLSENTSLFRASELSLFFPLAMPAFNLTAADHTGTSE